jgi:hypothetical protein
MNNQNRADEFSMEIDPSVLPGFSKWLFCPGMLFNAETKWWGNKEKRESRHEGLDFLLYLDHDETVRHIDETFQVPVLANGVVAGIIGDFVGKSIIVEHPAQSEENGKILTFYAHTAPIKNLTIGDELKKGEIIASVAGIPRRATSIAPHLHLTVARLHSHISYEKLDWKIMSTLDPLILLDPLKFINSPYRISGDEYPACISVPLVDKREP